jgi:hypothetical protein
MNRPVPFRLTLISAAFALSLVFAVTRVARAMEPAEGQLANIAIPVQQTLDPIAFELCTPEGDGAGEKCEALGFPPSYKVPAGRRLVIEQVSGLCGSDANQGEPLEASIIAQTKGVVAEHTIIGIPRLGVFGGKIPLTLTRIYADANSSVTIGVTGIPAFSDRFCRLAFSGQLVKP